MDCFLYIENNNKNKMTQTEWSHCYYFRNIFILLFPMLKQHKETSLSYGGKVTCTTLQDLVLFGLVLGHLLVFSSAVTSWVSFISQSTVS